MKTKSSFLCFAVIVLVMSYSSFVCAGTISGALGGGVWDGWTPFQDDNVNYRNGAYRGEDWVRRGRVNPGRGGQGFDAEYLFYKLDGATLSLGLQTGFDISDGKYSTGGKDYWSGDMFLTINGNDYALDYGFAETKDYYGVTIGGQPDTAGLYEKVVAGGTMFYPSGSFAMASGDLLTDINFQDITEGSGSALTPITTDGSDLSYYRQVSFDVTSFLLGNGSLSVDAHWTMSCGNDAINGSFHQPVPEPGTIALLGIGLAGLVGVEKRRRRKKRAVDNS